MLTHITTGEEPTTEELRAIEDRALQILRSPYSSPAQVTWAIAVAPADFDLVFWENVTAPRESTR